MWSVSRGHQEMAFRNNETDEYYQAFAIICMIHKDHFVQVYW